MENSHKLALYVAYYLSRFNTIALENLGYSKWDMAFNDISFKLNVNKHSVKNWRDEFDPLFGHRAGWHQRKMIPSRVKVAEALENLSEFEVRAIVKDILLKTHDENRYEQQPLLNILSEDESQNTYSEFVPRMPTGKAAEEFFIKHYAKNKQPREGALVDCRDLGTGYDFRIETKLENYFIEVKGLAKNKGGILFTGKEWDVANIHTDKYFVVIICNLYNDPEITVIQNPALNLKPKLQLSTSIQVSWVVSDYQQSDLH